MRVPGSFRTLFDVKIGRPEFDSEHFRIFDFLMHRKRIRRIRFPQDPNPELEKHPRNLLENPLGTLETTNPSRGGSPPDRVLCLSLSGFSRSLRGFEAHRMLEELRIRILVFEPWGSASNPFFVHQKIEIQKCSE